MASSYLVKTYTENCWLFPKNKESVLSLNDFMHVPAITWISYSVLAHLLSFEPDLCIS